MIVSNNVHGRILSELYAVSIFQTNNILLLFVYKEIIFSH